MASDSAALRCRSARNGEAPLGRPCRGGQTASAKRAIGVNRCDGTERRGRSIDWCRAGVGETAAGAHGGDNASQSYPDHKEPRMQIEEIIGQASDAVGVRRIFGEPYERDGVTIIPAASIRGGGGGGGIEGAEGTDTAGADGEGNGRQGGVGSGGGASFGLLGRPVGAFVIKDGEASWRPAVDVTGIIQRTLLLLGGAVYLATRDRGGGDRRGWRGLRALRSLWRGLRALRSLSSTVTPRLGAASRAGIRGVRR